ncbi:MAG: hypothetical protein JKX78_00015 [Alteromonadaceae bacterium]|nr:hypothetical protein [Alteromonadaceae bacterium]
MSHPEIPFWEYPEGKTDYQIKNENGDLTTIRLEKWVADILQLEFDNVHKKVQAGYDKLCKEHPHISRREKGNAIRVASVNTANKYQETKKKVLGWNDNDFLLAL